MKTFISQTCLVLIFLLVCISSACAGNISPRYDTALEINSLYDSVELSYPAYPSAMTDVIVNLPGDWNGRIFNSVAAGLFSARHTHSPDLVYYVDPETLCIAVSSTCNMRLYPVVPGKERSFLGSILMPAAEDTTPPVTSPGTMLVAGASLIGLTSLRKRYENGSMNEAKSLLLNKPSIENLAMHDSLESRA